MDLYQEALFYLESLKLTMEGETEVLEEDVFQEEAVCSFFSPLQTESLDFPDTPTLCSPEEMLEKRFAVLTGFLESEKVYLRELDTLLMPMKALRASAGTSQPVLSSSQLQTVFYQVPEIRQVHQNFYLDLNDRLSPYSQRELESDTEHGLRHCLVELEVGDLFLKMVNHISLYGGFIENYEKAVEVVRKCMHSDPRFRTLAESMTSNNDVDKIRTKYTFEALLYRPLDRVTNTTLVLGEILRTTPEEHKDYATLKEVLRLSRSFLSGINESLHCKREVTLNHGMRRQLIRDGFVVDASDGQRCLRHVFLYTDLLLCTRFKQATRGKQDQYRFCWYLPLAGLRLHWVADQHRQADANIRLHTIRTKMHLLRQQLQQHLKGCRVLAFAARTRKKLEQMELMQLTHSPSYRLELHSPNGKSHTLLFSSLYELEEWREALYKLTSDNIETVPPDLLTLTSACVKLRMTQQPPLLSSHAGEEVETLCGTLSVAIHSASGLQKPACVYVCVEVDGYEFYDRQTQTHTSVCNINPLWDQELSFQVDGAKSMKVLVVSQNDQEEDRVLGKTDVKLDCKTLNERWRKLTLQLSQVEMTLSLKFTPHRLQPPSCTTPQLPVFCVSIGTVAQQEGVLVPHVVRCCVEEVERRGLDEVGIYRISGSASDINSLKAVFNSNLREAVTRLRSADVNVVSGVLKLYFRELPEPLIPTEMFQSLAEALDIQDLNSRLVSLVTLLQSCPDANRHTFIYLLHHLQRVSQKQDVNKMSQLNLATVFGPSLIRPLVVGHKNIESGVDISQEVVVQVQVVYSYLQCNNLPEAKTSLPHDSELEEETTQL